MNQSSGVIRVEIHIVIVLEADTTYRVFLVQSNVVDLNNLHSV